MMMVTKTNTATAITPMTAPMAMKAVGLLLLSSDDGGVGVVMCVEGVVVGSDPYIVELEDSLIVLVEGDEPVVVVGVTMLVLHKPVGEDRKTSFHQERLKA